MRFVSAQISLLVCFLNVTVTSTWAFDYFTGLMAIKKSKTGSDSTEIYVLGGEDRNNPFDTCILQTTLPLPQTGKNFKFLTGYYNDDRYADLYVIQKSGTASKKTEVGVLDGKSNFQTWLLRTTTALPETGDNVEFGLGHYGRRSGTGIDIGFDGQYPDIFIIKKSQTASKKTEVIVLEGESNFQTWIVRDAQTPLPETGDNFEFLVGGYRASHLVDPTSALYAIQKGSTASKTTEVTVFQGRNPGTYSDARPFWRVLLGPTSTALHETGDHFTFLLGSFWPRGRYYDNAFGGLRQEELHQDIYVVKKSGTGTYSTEVHILDPDFINHLNEYKKWKLQKGTPLPETGDTYDYDFGVFR